MVDLHDRILESGGGARGLLHRGVIAGAIERARYGPFPDEADLAERAAMLLRGIAQDHPFVDGNKRTAFETTDLFLEKNGVILLASEDSIVEFMVTVARGRQTIEEIAGWIRRHLQKR